MTYEFVPKEKLGAYGALNAVSVALANVMGPLFGGLISRNTTWRWIFFLNIPAGAFIMAVLFFAIPNGFPYQNSPRHRSKPQGGFKSLEQLDIFGLLMLLAGSLILSAALLEYSLRKGWSNPGTVLLIIFAILSWIVFIGWEWYVAVGDVKVQPLFPWDFVLDRPWMPFCSLHSCSACLSTSSSSSCPSDYRPFVESAHSAPESAWCHIALA